MNARAADYGQPRVRVRRLPDRKTLFGRRRVFEVEFTPYGADAPEWTRQTENPSKLVAPFLSGTDAYDVVIWASERWEGGIGPWASLFIADE